MGIDALDILFRFEKSFQVKFSTPERDFIYGTDKPPAGQTEPTAGQIHDRVCHVLQQRGIGPPPDSWPRVQQCIAEGIGYRGLFGHKLRPDDVRRESLIVTDLGCS